MCCFQLHTLRVNTGCDNTATYNSTTTILPVMAILVRFTLLTAFGIILLSALHDACAASNRFSTTESSVNCIEDYRTFENMTFVNNTENNEKLSEAFYPPYGHLPYSVIVDYKSTDANGSEVTLLSTPSCPRPELIWFSSMLLMYMRPEFLNRLSLFTLNYFEEWKPPKITILVPYPCFNVTTKFLLRMTSSVSIYVYIVLFSNTTPP